MNVLKRYLEPLLADRTRLLLFISALAFLLFFRAKPALSVYSPDDDACYVGWLYRLILPEHGGCHLGNFYAPGVALFWFPAGIVGRILAAITRLDPQLWIPPLIGLTTFVLWCGSIDVIRRIIATSLPKHRFNQTVLALLILLNVPVLYYATNRTTMAHVLEAFLAFATIYALIKGRIYVASLLAFWLTLTRYQDCLIFLLIIGRILDMRGKDLPRYTQWVLGATAAAGLAVVVKIGFFQSYGGWFLPGLLQHFTFDNTLAFFFGLDWGIIFTGTWLIAAFLLGLVNWRHVTWMGRASLVWIGCLMAFCIMWNGNGSDFGYRYLAGSYAGGLVLWLDLLNRTSAFQRTFKLTTIGGASVVTYLTWVFKTGPSLSLFLVNPERGWGNPTFLIEALKTFLHPWTVIRPIVHSPVPNLLGAILFDENHRFGRYCVHSGPSVAVLSFATATAVGVFFFALRRGRERV